MSCIACWRVKLILAIVLQVFCKSVDARTPGKSRSKDCSSGFVEKGTKQDLRRQYLSNWRVMGWANLFISEEDIHITNVYIIWQNTFFVDTVVITIFVLYWNVNVSTDVVINFLSLSTMLLWHQIWLLLLLIPSLFLCFLTFLNSSSCMALHLINTLGQKCLQCFKIVLFFFKSSLSETWRFNSLKRSLVMEVFLTSQHLRAWKRSHQSMEWYTSQIFLGWYFCRMNFLRRKILQIFVFFAFKQSESWFLLFLINFYCVLVLFTLAWNCS